MPIMFVEFSEEDVKFLHTVQNGYYKLYGRRRKIPIGRVIRGILLEYRNMMESRSELFEDHDPELVRKAAQQVEGLSNTPEFP